MNRLIFWLKHKKWIPYLVYSALALFILLPLFKSGYVFTMDMVFTPELRMPDQFNLLGIFLYLINFVLPSTIIQKSILFLVIFFAGISMHRLIPGKSEWPKYFAGIFYVINPFVYSRFLYGHLLLLLTYALFPFVIKSIFNYCKNPKGNNLLKVCLWFLLIGIVSLHGFILLITFFVVALIFYSFKERKKRNKLIKLIALSLLVIALCVAWLAIFRAGGSNIPDSISSFTEEDLAVFQTVEDEKFGLPFNVLALYGFWGDAQDQYVIQKDFVPIWPILAGIILVLVIWGVVVGFRSNKYNLKWKTGIFLTVGILSFILSLGIAWKPLAPLNQFLYDYLPFYYGFREPQKFIALLCLAYAFLGSTGVRDIIRKLEDKKMKILRSAAIVFFIVLPFLYSPGLCWGFWGQLRARDYPSEWYEVNSMLNKDQEDFRVLFLPWHQYMYFHFAERIIANPTPRFFDKETIAGDNMQIGDIETHSTRPESEFIEDILQKRETIRNFGQELTALNVKYIILAKEADYIYYTKTFLDRQEDLELIYNESNLSVYQNKAVDNL